MENSFSFGSATSSSFAFAPSLAITRPTAARALPIRFSSPSRRPEPGWIGSIGCWWASMVSIQSSAAR